jgi:hypothetical protein
MLKSLHLVLCMVSIVHVENTMIYGWSGARILLQVGCQVGGDYRCNFLYLVVGAVFIRWGLSVGPLS